MSILASDFSTQVVIPALQLLAPAGIPYSQTAHDLLMGTAAQESLMGTYLVQQSGPGVGVFMATPSLVPGVISQLTAAQQAVLKAIAQGGDLTNLTQIVTNLVLATMVARAWYWLVAEPLPADTIAGLWGYYKMWYNTPAGAATEIQWNTNWGLTGIALPAS
jgi:hypothetical protein